MSDDLSVIHAQTSAILEEFYDEKGRPDELDEAFIQEYFKLVKDDLNLDDAELEEAEVATLGPHRTEANLSQPEKGLIDVYIPDQREKFVVNVLKSVKTLPGTSRGVGRSRGKGTYVMTVVKGLPSITIRAGSAVFLFIGTQNKVGFEKGNGEWKKV